MQFVKINQNYIAKQNIFNIKKNKQNENVVVRHSDSNTSSLIECYIVVVVVVVNFIKHQNRAITGERVAARAAPSYQYVMVLVIIT